jgi:hypothetical protein
MNAWSYTYISLYAFMAGTTLLQFCNEQEDYNHPGSIQLSAEFFLKNKSGKKKQNISCKVCEIILKSGIPKVLIIS